MPLLRSKDREQILGYRLIERLGAGGFGEVWKAEAPGGLLKAVKFVYGDMGGRQASQEVKALERIKEVRHPFVLSLERAEIVDGQLVVVSELADGTLLDRFEEHRARGAPGIPREELLLYLRDAAEALDFISSQFHLQHLDIKPSNLFLMGSHLKVGDFGLVREICQHSGVSMGGMSPAYAAPEMFGGRFSLYSDQYGLAIVYQEMLTGMRPFRGRNAAQLSGQHLSAYPTLTGLSLADQAVVGRALSKNPNDRFPTCGELVRALSGISGEPVRVSLAPAILDVDSDVAFADAPEPRKAWAVPDLADDPAGFPHDEATGVDRSDTAAASALGGCPSPSPSPGREGVIEPTLFVGLGGLAAGVLAQLKQMFKSRSVQPSEPLPLGWLLLDTDRAAIHGIRSPDLADRLEPDETVLMPLHGTDHYQAQWKQLLGWLGRHWLYRIPRSQCVEGIRALGRLALIDNAADVLARVREAVRLVGSRIKSEEERERFQVVVIASISGGTGGGCLVDIGFALRRILREEGLESAPVVSVLILAANARKDRKEMAHANVFVTLSELHSFLDTDCRFPGVKALGLSPTEGGAPLFDDVVLANFGDLAIEADARPPAQLLARYLYLLRGTACGKLAARQRVEFKKADCLTRIRRFRLGRVGFPRSELEREISREVCLRMIRRWLQGPPAHRGGGAALPFRFKQHGAPAPNRNGGEDQDQGQNQDREPGDSSTLLVLDEKAFNDVFLDRIQRTGGSDPLEFVETRTRELSRRRGRDEFHQGLSRLYDEIDDHFGLGSVNSTRPSSPSALLGKIREQFKHDRVELERKLDLWFRELLERSGSRSTTAGDRLSHLSKELNKQVDAAAARLQSLQVQRSEIRERRAVVSGAARLSLPNLLKPLHREAGPQADELCRYGRLWVEETALVIRSEILTALLAKTRQLEDLLGQVHRRIEAVGRLFLMKGPRSRPCEHPFLGRSVELFPGDAHGLDELRVVLADSFCNESRLVDIELRLQEEVFEAHGGFVAVMGREDRFLNQVFENDIFLRVAHSVGRWLENWDAAAILVQRYGSVEQAAREVLRFWQPIAPGTAEGQGLESRATLALPSSPTGRSMRENLERKAALSYVTDFAAIPDEVVLCVEFDDLSFATVAAAMISEHPWIEELAPKLVSRKDVEWVNLMETI